MAVTDNLTGTLTNYGITSTGFNIKRFTDILADTNLMLNNVTNKYGERIYIDSTQDSILQQVVAVVQNQNAQLWELALECYKQFNINEAAGASLSALVQFLNLERILGAPASVDISFGGVANTYIPIGTIVSDGEYEYMTDESGTITDNNTPIILTCLCTTLGERHILPNTITNIVTMINGLQVVTNPGIENFAGQNTETDTQLRARHELQETNWGKSQSANLFSAIANTPGVTKVAIKVNETTAIDADGIPPKEVAICIMGAPDTMVLGENIIAVMPLGVMGIGDTSYTSPVSWYTVKWTNASNTKIRVQVRYSVAMTEGVAAFDFDDQIAADIVEYCTNGGTGNWNGFTLGEDVYVARLYTPINQSPDFYVTMLQARCTYDYGATWTAWTSTSLSIPWNRCSSFAVADITRI